jgi:MoxR-like ATPase
MHGAVQLRGTLYSSIYNGGDIMIIEQSKHIINEIKKVIIGKDDVIEKILMTIYAGGHVLLEDCPGVGKTTLALAFSKVLGLEWKRIQFTPDTTPSDIVGFRTYNKAEDCFEYHSGAADCNLLLGDEINRTSPRTQATLLEVMDEGCVTVDGETHIIEKPFICIATQNPLGSSGINSLPESQLDRFMIKLSVGYPSTQAQVDILKRYSYRDSLSKVKTIASKEYILDVQNYISSVEISDDLLWYITTLCERTRTMPLVELGVSPRGIMALAKMSRASAVLNERNYVVPEDVHRVFVDVCAHRLVLKPQSEVEGINAQSILKEILEDVDYGDDLKR